MKINKNKVMTIFFIFLAFALPCKSFGFGLGVDPNEINIENVPLGKQAAVSALGGEGMKLSIKNKGASASYYTINILPSAQTSATLKEGYTDIPDISWITPENKEVSIEAGSTKAVELYLKIPKKKAYYNKKYQAVIEVKSKKNKSEEIFVLACQLKMFISTEAGGKTVIVSPPQILAGRNDGMGQIK